MSSKRTIVPFSNTKPKPDILLVKMPPWEINLPPLGIACLSSYLERQGVDVKILDLNIEIYKSLSSETRDAWKDNDFFYWQTDKMMKEFRDSISWIIEKILSFDTAVIGFSLTVSSCKLFNEVIAGLKDKAPDKIIVVGGPFTAWRDFRNGFDINKDLIDYFVIGEGELPLYQIMRHINSGGKNDDMPVFDGFSAWKDSPPDYTVCMQGPRIAGLDDIPFPTYSGFDMDSYTDKRFISILAGRGCIRSCSFCNDTVMWGKPFRIRSAENVIEEMKYCLDKYNTQIFKFSDLILNGSIAFVDRFSGMLIKEGLKSYQFNTYLDIEWHGQIAVRKGMDITLFRKMRKSGFKVANIGVESFSDNVLRLMNKGYNADDAVKFLRYQKESGIEVQINMIVGFPGETEDDFKENQDYLLKAAPYIDYVGSISTCGVSPGSELFRDPEKFNIDIKDHFYWHTKDGKNDIYIRMERYKRLLDFLKSKNIRTLGVSELDSMQQLLREREEKEKAKT